MVSYVSGSKQIEGLRLYVGEENNWCEREVGIEGCRIFCSELHVCYCSPDIINIIVAKKIKDVPCGMHIVLKEGIRSFLRKPEQLEPLERPQIMV